MTEEQMQIKELKENVNTLALKFDAMYQDFEAYVNKTKKTKQKETSDE